MWQAETSDVALFASMPRFGDLGVHGVVDLKRSFTREELTRALAATIESFPVLGCLYEPRFFRDRWVRSRAPLGDSVIVEAPRDLESATRTWTRAHIDPTRERPIRVVQLARGAEGSSRLIVSLSHVAVDGAGMGAVAHVLGSHLYGMPPALPLEGRRDLGRALDGLSLLHAPAIARDSLVNTAQVLRVLRASRRERPYEERDEDAPESGGPRVRMMVFEPSELAAIQARCGARTSVNDILVAGLARAGARRSKGGPVPVLYTMDLRRYTRSPYFSAANTSSILTVLLERADTMDLRAAAEAVRAITEQHRKSLVGPAFAATPVALAGPLPHGLLRRIVPILHLPVVDVPLDRGLFFTNVGRLDRGLAPFLADLESISAVGPNARGVKVPVIVAFGLRGRLHLELFAPPSLASAALQDVEREIRDALELG